MKTVIVEPIRRWMNLVAGLCGAAMGSGLVQIVLALLGRNSVPLWAGVAVMVAGAAGWGWVLWRASYTARLRRARRRADYSA